MTFLIFLTVILLIIGVIVVTVSVFIVMDEEGGIIPEDIITEYFNKIKDTCVLTGDYWGEINKLSPPVERYSDSTCEIREMNTPQIRFLFPYYISDVGLIPAWYKVTKEVKAKFNELGATKRDKFRKKLGL
jgi:hypothetical protein